MPAPRGSLSEAAAAAHVEAVSLRGAPGSTVGLEAEWFASGPVPAGLRLPFDSRLTVEPGGQVELSTRPFGGPAQACRALLADAAAVEASGVSLTAVGMHPTRSPVRVVDSPRYRAMEAYFDAAGDEGRTMMCNTASLQVNVALGTGAEAERRWALAHRLGPVLAGAFANSAVADGSPTGWRSTRLANWLSMDPTRTHPVGGPLAAWVDYALDARVMLVRGAWGRWEALVQPMTFRQWVRHGHALGWPTTADLDYHLTTLFPPVRPRGWLELRFLDAQPAVAAAALVTSVLLVDPVASDMALAATEPLGAVSPEWWRTAAAVGLAHPLLAAVARCCFEIAASRLTGAEAAAVAAYLDGYVARGRCPADDAVAAVR